MQVILTYIFTIFLVSNAIIGIVTILFYRSYLVFKTRFGKSLLQVLLLMAVHSCYLLLNINVFKDSNPELTIPFSLLYGPLMYMALQKESFTKYPLVYRVLNFTPFFLVVFSLILCIVFPDSTLFSENNFIIINYGITSLLFLYYGAQLIKAFVNSVKLNSTEANPKEFSFFVAMILISASLVYLGFLFFNPGKDYVHSFFLLHIIMTLCVILTSFKLIKIQKKLLKNERIGCCYEIELEEEEKNIKYAKSRLDDEQLLIYKKAIESLDDTFFYNSDLNLEMLEEQLKIKKYYLTQVFSLTLDTSFTNYTNNKRVEYAKQVMQENAEIKSTELAFMVGFNSVQNFNKVFQSIVGQTPAKYRSLLKKSSSRSSKKKSNTFS